MTTRISPKRMTAASSAPTPVSRKPSIGGGGGGGDADAMFFQTSFSSFSSLHSSSIHKQQKESFHTCSTVSLYESDSDGYTINGSHRQNINSRHMRVRFAVAVKKNDTLSHRSYTQEERDACWYTVEEKKLYLAKRTKTIMRMEAGKKEKKKNGRPYRGLEHQTLEGCKALMAQSERTVYAVMDEQDAQWEAGVYDEMRIAEISRKVTAGSLKRALRTARQDEDEAMAIQGTLFDDVNAITDDESTVGMASVVAQKRREREFARLEKKKKANNSTKGATCSDAEKKRRAARRKKRTKEAQAKGITSPPPCKKKGTKKVVVTKDSRNKLSPRKAKDRVATKAGTNPLPCRGDPPGSKKAAR